jgi:hypothetical protein
MVSQGSTAAMHLPGVITSQPSAYAGDDRIGVAVAYRVGHLTAVSDAVALELRIYSVGRL